METPVNIQVGGTSLTLEQFLAWARYLYWADVMSQQAESVDEGESETPGPGPPAHWFPLIAYSYASLHVVVEGWKGLGLQDPVIDALLRHKEGYTDRLRRFRNGMCHYQPHLIEGKLLDLLGHPNHVLWVHALHQEFVRFFWDWIRAFTGTEQQCVEFRNGVRRSLRGMPRDNVQEFEHVLLEAERLAKRARPGDVEAQELGRLAREGREALLEAKGDLLRSRLELLEKLFSV